MLTYCSAMSPHDNYYFQNKEELVYGVVEPPSLDLVNRELIESHLHSTWLSCVKQEFNPSIPHVLDIEIAKRPIRAEIADVDGHVIGTVTSGGPSPTLGRNIAMGYVPPAFAELGTELKVVVRGKPAAAEVVATPFVAQRYYRKPKA